MALQKKKAGVAQLAEHQPSKLRVAGSKPVSRSSENKGVTQIAQPFFFLSNLYFQPSFQPHSVFRVLYQLCLFDAWKPEFILL